MENKRGTKKSRHVALRFTLILPFVILILLAGGVSALLSYYNNLRAVDDMISHLTVQVGLRVQERLESYLSLPHVLNKMNADVMRGGFLDPNDVDQTLHYFWQQGLLYDEIGTIAFANVQGEFVGANKPENYMVVADSSTDHAIRRYGVDAGGYRTDQILRESPNYDARKRAWYQMAVDATHPIWSEINPSVTGIRLDASAVLPFYDENNHFKGNFLVDLSLAQLSEFLSGLDVGQTGQVFIFERTGDLIASSTLEPTFTINADETLERVDVRNSSDEVVRHTSLFLFDTTDALNRDVQNAQYPLKINGQQYLLQVFPYQDEYGIDWIVALAVPKAEFVGAVITSTHQTLGLTIFLLLAATIVGVMVVQRVLRPILELNDAAKALTAGDWDYPVEIVTRQDEIGELATSFNLMAGQLKSTIETLEQRVAERTAELQERNRDLESFAYSVSHDLKAPVRRIAGFSNLLLEDNAAQLDETGVDYLVRIQRATTLMSQLIDGLLAYSRMQRRAIVTTEVRLDQILQNILNEKEEEIRAAGIHVAVELPCETVIAESEGLRQALRNLLDNAIKFSSQEPKPAIEIGGTKTMHSCILWVKDNGIGFDMDFHDKIFQLFQRLHSGEKYPGTGVGLALTQKALQRMNGRVWAESHPGEGATFYLEIPTRKG